MCVCIFKYSPLLFWGCSLSYGLFFVCNLYVLSEALARLKRRSGADLLCFLTSFFHFFLIWRDEIASNMVYFQGIRPAHFSKKDGKRGFRFKLCIAPTKYTMVDLFLKSSEYTLKVFLDKRWYFVQENGCTLIISIF